MYGGDGEINEIGAANDGLGASARALAQFAHLHAVWGNGDRTPGSARDGSTPGASTYVWSRADGVDAAFTINTRCWPAGSPSNIVDQLEAHDRLAIALTVAARPAAPGHRVLPGNR